MLRIKILAWEVNVSFKILAWEVNVSFKYWHGKSMIALNIGMESQ